MADYLNIDVYGLFLDTKILFLQQFLDSFTSISDSIRKDLLDQGLLAASEAMPLIIAEKRLILGKMLKAAKDAKHNYDKSEPIDFVQRNKKFVEELMHY